MDTGARQGFNCTRRNTALEAAWRREGANGHRMDLAPLVLWTGTASSCLTEVEGIACYWQQDWITAVMTQGLLLTRGNSHLFWGCHGVQSAFKQCKNVYPHITHHISGLWNPPGQKEEIGLFQPNLMYISKQKKTKKILFRGSELQDRSCKTFSPTYYLHSCKCISLLI